MQRGIVNLSSEEISFAVNSIATPTNSTLAFLKEKLISAQQDQQSTNVQLSEEEVEILMDQLPPPTLNQPPEQKDLRKKLTSFLSELRN